MATKSFRDLGNRHTSRAHHIWVATWVVLVAASMGAAASDPSPAQWARQVFDATGVEGGLVVHVGCGDGRNTAALGSGERFQVQGLDRDPANVAKARQTIRSLELYGKITVGQLQGARLPYIDNMVNLLVSEDLGDVPKKEVIRVLVPRGVAYLKKDGRWITIVKSWPGNIDQWTHYMHDATGNAVAHDDVVGPPRHLQWLGSPRWSRHHDRMASMSAMVSAGGRVFYIMDQGSRVSILLKPQWTLVARDAFNGTILWKKPIDKWHSHLWPLKSGPTQLARRLVAVSPATQLGRREEAAEPVNVTTPQPRDTVYVTLGIDAPLTALDAATGEVLRTFEGSKGTEEVIASDGRLFLLVNQEGTWPLSKYAPLQNVGDQGRVGREFQWDQRPRRIVAYDANTGRSLWTHQSPVAPLTLASDGHRVYFYDGSKVVCLDRSSGEPDWTSEPVGRRKTMPYNFGPKLVVYDSIVLFAGGDRAMQAFDAQSGKKLWTSPHEKGSYQSPEDLLVAGGLIWSAPTTVTRDSGVFTGRDPRTGEVKSEFPPNVDTYWFHHRCYMAKATDKFLLPSRTGVEFVDHETENWDINHWVRGGCLYGVMPCNGLLYTPPHNCACYPETKLFGLNALAPASQQWTIPEQIDDEVRLERGPAYETITSSQAAPDGSTSNKQSGKESHDWPTYRHDATRSGFTSSSVPARLKPAWQARLGGRLTAVVVAQGKVFVADRDTHTLYALDANTGQVQWSETVGGSLDSPPTVHDGRVLFGAADGWIYCLSASDGQLAWRFRAAPLDLQLMAFEQIESVWPVHGSLLVQDGSVYAVAGRSSYLDGGMRLVRLDLKTGRKLAETVLNERDPQSGENLQSKIQILNMPVGLPDVLSSDGKYVYMRSQVFDLDGIPRQLDPHAGEPEKQGSVQRGETAHLFAPLGFLDDTYFHRSYWVFGRSFAGGHGGYYQAGKFTPSGRILVADETTVYGQCRKPQYYRWTTPLEHHLFAASKVPPDAARTSAEDQRPGAPKETLIRFEKKESLNPTNKPLGVVAWVKAEKPDGVILARGGPVNGYALVVQRGQARFVVRVAGSIYSVASKGRVVGRWVHMAGVMTPDNKIQIFVDGKPASAEKKAEFIATDPYQSMQIGADEDGAVGDYRAPMTLTGTIDQVKVYHGTLTAADIEADFRGAATGGKAAGAELVLACSFDKGDASDAAAHGNHGTVAGAQPVPGKFGGGMRFTSRPSHGGGSYVKHHWTQDIPILVRAMVLADKTLFVAGPADVVDEEYAFERLTARDRQIHAQLAEQQAVLDGREGGLLWAVSVDGGIKLAEHQLDALPVWDGMAAAYGQLYVATTDGTVVCLGGER